MSDGAPPWSFSDEAIALQDICDGRATGQEESGLSLAEDVQQLLRSPTGMAQTQGEHRFFDLW